MVIETVAVALDALSITVTPKDVVPAVVGMPLTTPFPATVNPAGSAGPGPGLHVRGAISGVADKV